MAQTKPKSKTAKEERKRNRKLQQLRESESRWWQRVLFDLTKARAARDSLAEFNGEVVNPLMTLEDGTSVDLNDLGRVIEGRVEELMEALGKSTYGRRKG
ncbi:MAG: hypothetical protein R3258_00230 [Acidimicrobiia bacterium]|nr:hypothetical protein [Acidimicrobiia bacterium]